MEEAANRQNLSQFANKIDLFSFKEGKKTCREVVPWLFVSRTSTLVGQIKLS